MLTNAQNEKLEALREKIREYIGGKRLKHTYAVETEIGELSKIYCPEKEYELRVAGLLHDITKELPLEKQLQLCNEFGIIYTELDKTMPKTFHAKTAAELAKRNFPELVNDEILSAIRYHTTGREDMTLSEQLLYLADYIEDTRTFKDCVELRVYFYSRLKKAKQNGKALDLLKETMLLSFDMTIRDLLENQAPVHIDTVKSRNAFLASLNN